MPRRAPPTALRLVPGPTPPRGVPKHTLPSMPHPIFRLQTVVRGPTPRTRADVGAPPAAHNSLQAGTSHRSQMSLPALFLPSTMGAEVAPAPPSRASSPTSNISNKSFVPGPWDHSRSITVAVDVDALLAAPKPAAVSPVTGLGWTMI